MSRLYADENVAQEVVNLLRANHDVRYPQEQGIKGASDVWHLRQAARDSRVLITVNRRDFEFLHRVLTTVSNFGVSHEGHHGILTVTKEPDSHEWHEAIEEVLGAGTELAARLNIWNVFWKRWDEDPWVPEN